MSDKKLNQDLIVLFDHLEQCQRAGIPIFESLREASDMVDHRRLKWALLDLYDRVKNGQKLSDGMGAYPHFFSKITVNLVRTSEQTGELARSFHYCKKHVKRVDETRSRIKKILRYPIIVSVLLMILEFVSGGRIVISGFLTLLIALGILKLARTHFTIVWDLSDKLLLLIPGIGPWIKQYALGKFASTFAYLFQSGMSIQEALKYSADSCPNYQIRLVLEEVKDRVKNGQSVYKAFQETNYFPSFVLRMIRAGEVSGNLGNVFHEIADVYDKDTTDSMDLILKTAKPLSVIILGGLFILAV